MNGGLPHHVHRTYAAWIQRRALPTIRRARALFIHSPTSGAYARNADGGEVEPKDATAARWCIVGAIIRSCKTYDQAEIAVEVIERVGHLCIPLHLWADGSEPSAVVMLLDRVIEAVKAHVWRKQNVSSGKQVHGVSAPAEAGSP
jgi:hypothetical protein